MKKKIIFILMCFIMYSNSVAAEENTLPALPVMETENNANVQDISFWQKIKNFFGFGGDENKEISKIQELPVTTETSILQDEVAQESLLKLEENTPQISESAPILPPLDSDFDNNIEEKDTISSSQNSNISPSNSDSVFNNEDTNLIENKLPSINPGDDHPLDDLKLPDGFEDIEGNDQSELSKKTHIENNNNDSAISKDAENLQLEIPSLDDLKLPDGFEDIKDIKENVNKKINDNVTSPKSEDLPLIIPSLNNSDLDVKNKDTDTAIKEISVEVNVTKQNNVQDSDKGSGVASVTESSTSAVNNKKNNNTTPTSPVKTIETKPSKASAVSLIPVYASESSSKNNDSKLLEYKNDLKTNKQDLKNITHVSAKELNNNKKEENEGSIDKDANQTEFIKNEAQVLTLPDDEIVLGHITEEAEYEMMEFTAYIDIFWKEYNKLAREPKTRELKNYIRNYNENFYVNH